MFLPLLRGRWRGAPDEVVDVNDRPFIRHSGFAAERWLLPSRIAASPRGEGFCAASLLPLLRGRWRGAPDEVVDVNDRPFIRHSGFAAERWLPLGETLRGTAAM